MNALVLSGGGMYGAYQAGAWKALAEVYKPDLIVGASIGAVNAWAIAGGCDPDELVQRWLTFREAAAYRWKWPATPFGGVLDSALLQTAIRDLHLSFQPRIPCAIVVTDLLRLQPVIVPDSAITWEHLAATTALPGVFDQMRIGGRLYSDGGLLANVPLWAAAELGATRAVVIDLLPKPFRGLASSLIRGARKLSRFEPYTPPELEVIKVAPADSLGTPSSLLYWTLENARKWAEAGQRDAEVIKHSLIDCFERE